MHISCYEYVRTKPFAWLKTFIIVSIYENNHQNLVVLQKEPEEFKFLPALLSNWD